MEESLITTATTELYFTQDITVGGRNRFNNMPKENEQ